MTLSLDNKMPGCEKGIKFGAYFFLCLGLYWGSFTWLIQRDWAKEDYNYAYLIPFIVMYLIWEKRDILRKIQANPSWAGIFPLLLGICFFWLGELGGEYFTLYISLWLVAVGLCWLNLGWQKFKVIAFAVIFSLAMFPLPNFIYKKITLKLQLISSQLGVGIIQLYGLSAYREGNVIDLGFTKLQVVEACSGLRYMIPLLVLGILLAYFYKTGWWRKIVLVISTIPLSILTNSLRIALTGILYKHFGAEVAEGFFHGFSGWFIFMFSLVVLLAEMWILAKIGRRPENVSSDKPQLERSEGMEQTDSDNRHESNRYTGRNRSWKALFYPPQFVVAILLLGATLAFSQGIDFREKIPIRQPLSRFPLDIAQWRGVKQYLGRQIIDELDLSEYIMIDYKNDLGRNINFYVAYYESQRKGESIHSPETCLPGGGWEFKQAGIQTIPLADTGGESIQVNRASMQLGDVKQLSYYWFPQRGRVLTNAYQLKIYTFWDALTKHRTDGALVRLITPIYRDEAAADAEKRLVGFIQTITPILNRFLPGENIDVKPSL